jgi:hypothetical protein
VGQCVESDDLFVRDRDAGGRWRPGGCSSPGLVITVAGLLLLWRAPADGNYAVDLLPAFLALGLGSGMVFVTRHG